MNIKCTSVSLNCVTFNVSIQQFIFNVHFEKDKKVGFHLKCYLFSLILE